MICLICHRLLLNKKGNGRLCDRCCAEIFRCEMMHELEMKHGKIHIGFYYDGYLRELILRAKVKNDVVALAETCRIFQEKMGELISRLDEVDQLVLPVSSSFWGRIKGRFDVAQALSMSSFRQAEVYTHLVPGFLFSTKRAGKNHTLHSSVAHRIEHFFRSERLLRFFQQKISQAKSVVVVDDVITTGTTMNSMMEYCKIQGAKSISGIVMASSTHTVSCCMVTK